MACFPGHRTIYSIAGESIAGFGGSNNKGVEAASGNLIAIINSDAYVLEN